MIRPVTDRILIKVDPVPSTMGSILIPHVDRPVPQSGVVVAVGPGRWEKKKFVPTTTKPGQRVYWNKYDGCVIEDGGESFTVLCDERVLASE
jgi:chaperonin GroES